MKKPLSLILLLLAMDVTLGCSTISRIISPRTPAPTPTETPVPGKDLVGNWNMYYSWNCSGYSSYSSTTWTLFENNTFESGIGYRGSWTVQGSSFHLVYDRQPNTVYDGTISESRVHMEGTMQSTEAGSGCWYADKMDH
jgi:hypothetical protein